MVQPLIAVVGATGRQGGAVAAALLAAPARRHRVRALTRQPAGANARALAAAGAEVVAADLDHPPSLRRALDGAHGAFCATSTRHCRSPEHEAARGTALASAAAEARVAHVVWSSRPDTRHCAVASYDAKEAANAAFVGRDVPVTLVCPALPWDDLLAAGLRPDPRDASAFLLRLPLGDACLPGMALEDLGPIVRALFAAGDEAIGKSFGVAGEHLTGAQLAEQLGLALGADVGHLPFADDADALDAQTRNLYRFHRDYARACCTLHSTSWARELHPGTLSFAAWLARHRDPLHVVPRALVARGVPR